MQAYFKEIRSHIRDLENSLRILRPNTNADFFKQLLDERNEVVHVSHGVGQNVR